MSPQARQQDTSQGTDGTTSVDAAAQDTSQGTDGATSVDAAAQAYAVHLFETADRLNAEYDKLLKARTANRQSLRNMEAQSDLSTEQVEKLNKLYPERTLSDEALQRREERKAKRAKEKAEKEAAAKREADAKAKAAS